MRWGATRPAPAKPLVSFPGQGGGRLLPTSVLSPFQHRPVSPPLQRLNSRCSQSLPRWPYSPSIYKFRGLFYFSDWDAPTPRGCSDSVSQPGQGGVLIYTPPSPLPQHGGPDEWHSWPGRSCSVTVFGRVRVFFGSLLGRPFWFVKTQIDPGGQVASWPPVPPPLALCGLMLGPGVDAYSGRREKQDLPTGSGATISENFFALWGR